MMGTVLGMSPISEEGGWGGELSVWGMEQAAEISQLIGKSKTKLLIEGADERGGQRVEVLGKEEEVRGEYVDGVLVLILSYCQLLEEWPEKGDLRSSPP